MTDFDAIRSRHVQGPALHMRVQECRECRVMWPCDFIQADDARRRLVEAMTSMAHQFAYWSDSGGLWTGGLSALEETFDVLGWDDPHPVPESRCQRPDAGCLKRGDAGIPGAFGERYLWLCSDHHAEWRAALAEADA